MMHEIGDRVVYQRYGNHSYLHYGKILIGHIVEERNPSPANHRPFLFRHERSDFEIWASASEIKTIPHHSHGCLEAGDRVQCQTFNWPEGRFYGMSFEGTVLQVGNVPDDHPPGWIQHGLTILIKGDNRPSPLWMAPKEIKKTRESEVK